MFEYKRIFGSANDIQTYRDNYDLIDWSDTDKYKGKDEKNTNDTNDSSI